MNVICRARVAGARLPLRVAWPALMSPFGWERFKSGAALNREAAQSLPEYVQKRLVFF